MLTVAFALNIFHSLKEKNRKILFWQGKGEDRPIKVYPFCRTIKKVYRIWRAVLKSVSFMKGAKVQNVIFSADIKSFKIHLPQTIQLPPWAAPPQCFLWTWQTTSQSYLNFDENLIYISMPSWVQNSIFKQIKTTFTYDWHHTTAIVTVGNGKHGQCLKEVYNWFGIS